jgi:hypothetical protein
MQKESALKSQEGLLLQGFGESLRQEDKADGSSGCRWEYRAGTAWCSTPAVPVRHYADKDTSTRMPASSACEGCG